MTEFEFVEAIYLNSNYGANVAMNFVAVFLAYVIAAHFAGNALSRAVAVFVSITYSIFLIGPSIGILRASDNAVRIQAQYRLDYPDGMLLSSVELTVFQSLLIAFGPVLMGWIGSLELLGEIVEETPNMKFKSFLSVTRTTFGGRLTGRYASTSSVDTRHVTGYTSGYDQDICRSSYI